MCVTLASAYSTTSAANVCNLFDIPEPPLTEELDNKILELSAKLEKYNSYSAMCSSQELKRLYDQKIQAYNARLEKAREEQRQTRQEFEESLRASNFDPNRLSDLVLSCQECIDNLPRPAGFRSIQPSINDADSRRLIKAMVDELHDAKRRFQKCIDFLARH